MTYAIMGLVLLFMAFILIYKAKLTKDTSHFFNLTNTTAMRGFWCIIVILVHIPAVYQNRIQDLMGSLASCLLRYLLGCQYIRRYGGVSRSSHMLIDSCRKYNCLLLEG